MMKFILFFCILITFIGTGCEENTEMQTHLSDAGKAAISAQGGIYTIYDSEVIALWMIEKHLGEMVELMKEHRCLSK